MDSIAYHQNIQDIPLAYMTQKSKFSKETFPMIVYLSGFASSMHGTKARMLSEFCTQQNYDFIRFDYAGTGYSTQNGLYQMHDFTISDWVSDSLCLIHHLVPSRQRPIILIGSSMGAWIGLLLLQNHLRDYPHTSLIGIAAAPDFTKDLSHLFLQEPYASSLKEKAYAEIPCQNDKAGQAYRITQKFLEDGFKNHLLDSVIDYHGWVRLFAGMQDQEVPYRRTFEIAEKIASPNVDVVLRKNTDHYFSNIADMNLIFECLKQRYQELTY
jgi:uncharacterized protein